MTRLEQYESDLSLTMPLAS